MAHLIDMTNDRANMAYVGETPWHGLGEKMNDYATLDEWRRAAGLDWTIEIAPVCFRPKNTNGDHTTPQFKAQQVENRVALYRSDSHEFLSIMSGNRYNIVQPSEILEFYRDLVDGSRFSIETAGSLKGGAKIWALARGNLDMRVMGNDVIKPYLLLATACDGSMSTVASFTSVRVVCNNTLSMSVGNNGRNADIRVPHSRQFDAGAVREELGLIDTQFETFGSDVDALAATRVDDETAIKYFIGLYAKTDENGNVTNDKSLAAVTSKLMDTYRRGPGADLPSAKGTAWGLVNAVTRYQDFTARARSTENRFVANQFGPGANLKATAFETALALAA